MTERHWIMGDKVEIYRRENSSNWQCSTFLDGKNWRKSTGDDSLAHAKDFAEDWYLGLRGKLRAGVLKTGKTFKEAAERFLPEYEALTAGERNLEYVKTLRLRIEVHLIPFFGDKVLSEITSNLVQEYRIHRLTSRLHPKSKAPMRPSRSSLRSEIVGLRHVLKTAKRHGWLSDMPDLTQPYKTSGKIGHRAWFSPAEYKQLYEATRERAKNPKNPRWRPECEQLHDYVLFMANTGLRPDEAARLQFQDVAIVTDQATRERILEIEVRGKRGVGFCKSMPGAVLPFERVRRRKGGKPTDLAFGKTQRALLNQILTELDLRFDRDGQRRSAYSLRHSYICFRLIEGADIYNLAKNCRTSVEMIEKFYAVHLKDLLDASTINVRKKAISPPQDSRRSKPKNRRPRARRPSRRP